jgi:hypothetical protein
MTIAYYILCTDLQTAHLVAHGWEHVSRHLRNSSVPDWNLCKSATGEMPPHPIHRPAAASMTAPTDADAPQANEE